MSVSPSVKRSGQSNSFASVDAVWVRYWSKNSLNGSSRICAENSKSLSSESYGKAAGLKGVMVSVCMRMDLVQRIARV